MEIVMNKLSWVVFSLLVACITFVVVIDLNVRESPVKQAPVQSGVMIIDGDIVGTKPL